MPEAERPIETPIAELKRQNYNDSSNMLRDSLTTYGLTMSLIGAKGIHPEVVAWAINSGFDSLNIGHVINALTLRANSESHEDRSVTQTIKSGLRMGIFPNDHSRSYKGTSGENLGIDRAIKDSRSDTVNSRPLRSIIGYSAQRKADFDNVIIPEHISSTPILIVGAGASGLLSAKAMVDSGFKNITMIDQRGEPGGIWEDERVFNGSKNNPFPIEFPGVTGVGAAPGPGTDIQRLLRDVAGIVSRRGVKMLKGKVTGVKPGDLNHIVAVRSNGQTQELTAPIVIMAPGNGTPLPAELPGIVNSNISNADMGKRWQEVWDIDDARKMTELTSNGKPLILVGSGNSTAEMLTQIKHYNENFPDINIQFKVLTHYPEDSVYQPEGLFISPDGSHQYRLYRDIKAPNLTKMAGDLPDIDAAWRYARATNSVIPDMTSWDRKGDYLVVKTRTGKVHKFLFSRSRMNSLIGYGHTQEFLRSIGLNNSITDTHFGQITYDWDGELQSNPGATGRERVFPGYFALGPILKRPENPNAPVIPGDIFRMQDQLLSVILRAEEYSYKKLHGRLPGKS